jgi:hypothetical protein
VTFAERAVALLEAAAAGSVAIDEASELARDWLDASGGNVALSVLTGGEHLEARVVELCGLVLDAVGEPDGVADAGDDVVADGGQAAGGES